MPPARSRISSIQHDDARADINSHTLNGSSTATAGKTLAPASQYVTAVSTGSSVAEKRRHGHNSYNHGHHPPPMLEKQTSSGSVNANGAHAHEGIEGMAWDDVPLSVLHNYRYAYRLPVPSASSSFRHIVLSSAIGKKTPSRARGSGRISREALATTVRKNFNAQPIQENEVIVNFLYSIKNQDKKFRFRFPPLLGKRYDT